MKIFPQYAVFHILKLITEHNVFLLIDDYHYEHLFSLLNYHDTLRVIYHT